MFEGNGTGLDANTVWNTLGDLAGRVIDYKAAKTKAAPSGTPQASGSNPWFGSWGAFPQAEAKVQPGAVQTGLMSFMPIAVIAAVILALLVLVRR